MLQVWGRLVVFNAEEPKNAKEAYDFDTVADSELLIVHFRGDKRKNWVDSDNWTDAVDYREKSDHNRQLSNMTCSIQALCDDQKQQCYVDKDLKTFDYIVCRNVANFDSVKVNYLWACPSLLYFYSLFYWVTVLSVEKIHA